jgi:hypothetical protein
MNVLNAFEQHRVHACGCLMYAEPSRQWLTQLQRDRLKFWEDCYIHIVITLFFVIPTVHVWIERCQGVPGELAAVEAQLLHAMHWSAVGAGY